MAEKVSIKKLTDPPTHLSSMEKLRADENTQILGPDATLMRDLKGKHMIGGRHLTAGAARRMSRGKR